jgi:hypothetical protein
MIDLLIYQVQLGVNPLVVHVIAHTPVRDSDVLHQAPGRMCARAVIHPNGRLVPFITMQSIALTRVSRVVGAVERPVALVFGPF